MTLNARRRILVACQKCFAMGRLKIFLFLFTMARAAAFRHFFGAEFGPRNSWRLDVMLAVTILAHLVDIACSSCKDSFMKWMLRFGILVASLALNWCDLLFVGEIVRIESRVAGNADEFLVSRMSKNLVVNEQRDSPSLTLRC